jgi:glyoxylase-like metal-dependent hydrolase (beta-lactamase superfamily II)
MKPPTGVPNCNAAVIVNRDHVLVVDTHSKTSAAKALIRQIRDEITNLPVRNVVDSHLHGDHAMGNQAYPEVFGSGVSIKVVELILTGVHPAAREC